jgi:hypothetical protein
VGISTSEQRRANPQVLHDWLPVVGQAQDEVPLAEGKCLSGKQPKESATRCRLIKHLHNEPQDTHNRLLLAPLTQGHILMTSVVPECKRKLDTQGQTPNKSLALTNLRQNRPQFDNSFAWTLCYFATERPHKMLIVNSFFFTQTRRNNESRKI